MKKLIAITLCAIMALSSAACSNEKLIKNDSKNQINVQTTKENVQIPSPFIDCKTMEDAGKITGFTITVPKNMPQGYVQKLIQATEDNMMQVFFESGENTVMIRKAKGNEDISGVYTVFDENTSETVGNLKISLKGTGGKINVATWVDGAYAYSIVANVGETGLDASTINDMVRGIC